MIIYFNGNYINEEDCFISPYDRGFLFADGIYEVIKYTGKKFFEFDSHLSRLNNGLEFLKINYNESWKLLEICNELISINNFKNSLATVYIQITRGISKPRNHLFPEIGTPPTVLVNVSELKPEDGKSGFRVILTEDIRWSGCNIKSTLLLPNVLARQKSYENNADEALLVRDGLITEGSHTNFCAIRDGNLYTTPLSNNILPGITRKVVLNICREIGIPIFEISIKADELNLYSELFLTSTKMDIVPVLQVGDRLINNGIPGPVTVKLSKILKELINN
ncbi:MAG TPA: aminotransferase class IV [Ignavibacteria bacterium]